jgi:hypothetical protein
MSSSEEVSTIAEKLTARLEHGLQAGEYALLTSGALQGLMAALCRTYVLRVEAGEQLTPVAPRSGISDTEAMTMASAMLKANNLQVFELGMWQSWTGS